MNIQEYKGVWVLVEQRGGQIQKVSQEILGKGREIADKLGQELTAILLGKDIKNEAQSLIHLGADRVIVGEHECFEPYTTEPYAKVISQLIEERKPEILMIGATTIGRDLAPRISARVKTGLTADCTALDIDETTKNLLMTRPTFGGNLMATIFCPDHRPQMSSIRPGVMQKLQKDESRKGSIEVITPDLSKDDLNVEVIEVVKSVKQMMSIEDAAVLVSGGRGIECKENFALVEGLALELGGQVSASRAVVDAGWVDKDRQVGQTGKTVRPNLYLACGISGAIQHVAGMEDSDLIIAINKTPDAPIFEVADLGIVGDIKKVLPALVEELRTAKEAKD